MTLGDDLHEPAFETPLPDPLGGSLMTAQAFNPEGPFPPINNGNNLLAPPGQDALIYDATQGAPSPNGNTREAEVAKEHYLLTAADPAGEPAVSPEERLKQVINAKVEAGILRPFNYVKGYARLQKYMEIQ
jgi:hypothetical protein